MNKIIEKMKKNWDYKERYPDSRSQVDRTGYQKLEVRIKNLQKAGITLAIARDQQFDTIKGSEDIEPPPFRGLEPDLADFAELQRQNADRLEELKRKHSERKAKSDEARESNTNPPTKHTPQAMDSRSEDVNHNAGKGEQ